MRRFESSEMQLLNELWPATNVFIDMSKIDDACYNTDSIQLVYHRINMRTVFIKQTDSTGSIKPRFAAEVPSTYHPKWTFA